MPGPNGQSDAYFLAYARRILRDQGNWQSEPIGTDGFNGVLAAGYKPYRVQRAPVVKGSVNLTAPSGPWAVVYDVPPSAGQVEVVTDTGELIFYSAPATGTLSVTYQYFRFSDQEVLDVLIEGLNSLYPECWLEDQDSSIVTTSPTVEYALPSFFQDPRLEVLTVEVNPPGAYIMYERIGAYRLLRSRTSPKLIFQKPIPPGSTVRLTYNTPYLSLADTETQIMHLPCYYAVAELLAHEEAVKSRVGDLATITGDGATPAGQTLSSAEYWRTKFYDAKAKLARSLPHRRMLPDRSVERQGFRRGYSMMR